MHRHGGSQRDGALPLSVPLRATDGGVEPNYSERHLHGRVCRPQQEALQGGCKIRELPPDIDSKILGGAGASGVVRH